MQNEQQDIQNILDEFDFHKVEKVMEALNWKWASSAGVPTIGDMRRCVRMLFKHAVEADASLPNYSTATGGFEVSRDLYVGDAKRYYALKFIVSDWNNYE